MPETGAVADDRRPALIAAALQSLAREQAARAGQTERAAAARSSPPLTLTRAALSRAASRRRASAARSGPASAFSVIRTELGTRGGRIA